MGMDILGGDKIRTKSAKSKQCRAGCAFGCTLRLYAGLCLAVLTLSQPDAQPALCREPTGCSPVEDKAMKCPSSYPLVLRRKDDSVVHVNMPCNRWTCAACCQRKITEWSRHASKCFQEQAQMSWATCPIDAQTSTASLALKCHGPSQNSLALPPAARSGTPDRIAWKTKSRQSQATKERCTRNAHCNPPRSV